MKSQSRSLGFTAVLALACSLGVCISPARGNNLVANGSFEDHSLGPIFPWTYTGDIDITISHWLGHDGVWSVDLNGSQTFGDVSQSFATVANTDYTLSFWLAGNPGGGPIIKDMTATVLDGATTLASNAYSFDVTGVPYTGGPSGFSSNMGWVQEVMTFTAGSSLTTITFASTTAGAFGPVIDDVSIVPEAASIVLALFGIIGLATATFRRRRRSAIR